MPTRIWERSSAGLKLLYGRKPKESIASVTVPVLTIHGRKDRNAPYGGGREWDTLPSNARLATIEGAAHMSWVEFPEIVFPAIDLLLNGH